MTHEALLHEIARRVLQLQTPGTTRVGIDGVDGAGKTTLANDLARGLASEGRQLIRASIDDFHHPREYRYRLGRDSPEGYYRDSFDLDTLTRELLDPLAPGGSGRFRRAAFDHRSDAPVEAPVEQVQPGAILLFDGIFLHRPELRGHWDLSVFLATTFPVSVARGAARDGASPDPEASENRRYVEGQRLYLRECDPERRANLVVDYDELESPAIRQLR